MASEEKNTIDQCVQAKGPLDEDLEFRDMVMQTLERNGALAKINATLRASICIALDEDIKLSQLEPLKNKKMDSYMRTPQGKLMFNIVREFLEYFNLTETLMVYDSETSLMRNSYKYGGKKKIQNDLGLETSEELNVSLLEHILHVAQSKSENLDINLNVSSINSTRESTINENSYDGTPSESTPKISSFSEADIEKKTNNMNSTYNVNSSIDNSKEGPILNSTYDLLSPAIVSNSTKPTSLIPNRTSLEAVEESLTEYENSSERKSSIKEENISSVYDQSTIKQDISESFSLSKQSLSLLTDLPPLPRLSDPLCSSNPKNSKDKTNLKELDKMFDLADEYEEDFDLSISKDK